jgi:hypothetical protein
MAHQPDPPAAPAKKSEAVTPVIERTLNELLLLVGQLFVTPFAVLFNTKGFRSRLAELHEGAPATTSSALVARPVLFYLIWAAVFFVASGLYFKALNGDLLSRVSWTDLFGHSQWTTSPGEKGFALFGELSKAVGQSQATIIVAFGLLLIIATKALLISLAGRLLNCGIHFNTALQASAYAFGTFLFSQYVFLLSYVCLSAAFGWVGAGAGFYILAYGSVAVSIVLVLRTLQIIRSIDKTEDVRTFASWFVGAALWHLIVMYLSLLILKQQVPEVSFVGIWVVFLGKLVGLKLTL